MSGTSGDGLPPPDAPVPLSLIADLQAGLLDDETAARLRSRIRTDPDAVRDVAALDRVRRDLAGLAGDADSAPDVPDDVTARIADALRAADPPQPAGATHAVRQVRSPRLRTVAVIAGVAATVVGIGVAVATLGGNDAVPSARDTVDRITATAGPGDFPVPAGQIYGVIDGPVDAGPLAAPQRLTACLTALGYPPGATALGARQVRVADRPAVLLVLPGDDPRDVTAAVVDPTCGAGGDGPIATTTLRRP
jgi:anti-sigma factor RsiW